MKSGIAPPDAPFVLVDQHRGTMRLAALCPRAAKLGLEPGLPLADARGRIPELAVIAHDPSADRAVLYQVMRLCGDYSPAVAPDPQRGVMLDITGCAHLQGGEQELEQALITRVTALRLTLRSARADTPDAARALARFGGRDVCALPLAALAMDGDVQIALRRAGFRTIGDLADVPTAPLAARFGVEVVRLLDRLLGREDPHIVPHHICEPVQVELRFAEPVSRTVNILDAIEALLSEAAPRLAKRGEGGRVFVVRLFRSDGYIAWLTVKSAAPTRDPALLMRLICERIEGLADPLDPGFGYDSIDLSVPVSEPLMEQQPGLEAQPGPKRDAGPLYDRLATRHGAMSVLRFQAEDSHIPERACGLAAIPASTASSSWLQPEPGEPPLRPLLLFDPPQPVEVIASVPDGPPLRFFWHGQTWRVVAQEGPERIAPEWWRRADGHAQNPGLTRDYYRVEEEGGSRFWLFRRGLYGQEKGDPRWYMHGVFA